MTFDPETGKPGYPNLAPPEDEAAQYFAKYGQHAPWTRVWRDGKDVNDEPRETWPLLWRDPAEFRRRASRKRR